MKFGVLFIALILSGCTTKIDIPTEFPTPPPTASATPLTKLQLKRNAELEKQFAEIAKAAKGKVGVAAAMLETGDAALLNADVHYPMQSVYKLPISMAVMDEVRKDNHSLDEQIAVTKDDFVRQGQASTLRDEHPDGGIFTLRELIRLALVDSDGSASDVLLRILGGPREVQSYLSQIGIEDMKVVSTEQELGKDWETQYQNWTTPIAAIEVLRYLDATSRNVTSTERSQTKPTNVKNANQEMRESIDDNHDNAVLDFAINVVTGPNRLKGLLPKGTTVAHKTGTGGTKDGITGATNDIGIIYLPNGKHLAVAMFVSDSPADEKTREAVIARIAKAAWDKWSQ